MKKESRRDNLLLGCSSRRSLEGPSGLPFISSDDIDFQDVFGGPPRRFSLYETTRYSSDGEMDVEETARSRGLSSQKPVFGESSSVNRRKNQRSDFFDDIFQGVKSRSSSGSAIIRSYEPLGTSLTAQLSLASATLNKAVDSPTFVSTSTLQKKENTSNGISSLNYSLSRFSIQAKPGHDITSNVQQSNCPRLLSNEVSLRNKESSFVIKSDESGLKRDSKRDSDITEAPTDIEHSYFSLYKWEGREVPVAMPSPDGIGLEVDVNSNHLPEISISEKIKKEVFVVTEKAPKPVPGTLHSFLHDKIEAQDDQDNTTKTGRKVNVGKATKVFGTKVGTSKYVKKNNSSSTEVNKGGIQRSSKIPEGNVKRNGVRGKVKDFVRMFNQETYSKPKCNLGCESQTFRSDGKVNCIEVDNSNLSTSNIDNVMHFSDINTMMDAFFELDENVEHPEKHHSPVKSAYFTTTENSPHQNDSSPCSESIPDDSEVRSDKIEDHIQEKNMMQESFANQVELPPTNEDHKAKVALDAKIIQWSTGKEGNIRSLISTLHYVLWAESGWKPVPLVNIIELNAVKKSYQRALLCLHPDKLQQKSADSHKKYIAEKVFDILQEAWDHFNSLDPL